MRRWLATEATMLTNSMLQAADAKQFEIVNGDSFAGEELNAGCKAAFCFFDLMVNSKLVS